MFIFVWFAFKTVSSLVCNHHEEEERAGCFAFVVLRMSCYCICSLALPYGAVGGSAVCDCGTCISSYLLTFFYLVAGF